MPSNLSLKSLSTVESVCSCCSSDCWLKTIWQNFIAFIFIGGKCNARSEYCLQAFRRFRFDLKSVDVVVPSRKQFRLVIIIADKRKKTRLSLSWERFHQRLAETSDVCWVKLPTSAFTPRGLEKLIKAVTHDKTCRIISRSLRAFTFWIGCLNINVEHYWELESNSISVSGCDFNTFEIV